MIVFFHLLNDRSGSPKVLVNAISALETCGEKTRLFVGSAGSGCLDEVSIPITRYWYRRGPNRLATLFAYILSQAHLFIKLVMARDVPSDAVLYINTLLPFGAALYGVITRRPVVYHLHEVSVTPLPLKWFLINIARVTASRLIYVSDFHRSILSIPSVTASTIYNALDDTFLQRAISSHYHHRIDGSFNVLMLASLRDYKGVPEFIDLANSLKIRTDISFHLVVNDDEREIESYFERKKVPSNILVHARTSDPGTFYGNSSLVLNLSRPDLWVETFGLTVLEAMAYGVPVIVPPVGGPKELVEDGQEGFQIDSRESARLISAVLQLADDETACLRLSAAGRVRASNFSFSAFQKSLVDTIYLEMDPRG